MALEGGTSPARAIVRLFEGVVEPPLKLLCAQSGETVDVPASFTIKMGGGSVRLYPLLSDPVLFCSLAQVLQKGILDVLHLVMIRGTYDVIRFQCCGPGNDDQVARSPGLTRILLSLLRHCQSQNQNQNQNQRQSQSQSQSQAGMQMQSCVGVQKRIVHLLGLTSAAGISTSDLRDMLVLMRHPSELTLSLLQALSTMVRHDNAIVKAAPPSFFNLGGRGAGLESSRGPFPFPKEYQFFTWFRVENFASSSSGPQQQQQQHIVSIQTPAGHGIDVFIRDQLVHVQLSFSRGQEQTIVLGDNTLKRGVWYHFCIRHGRPRMALFSRDELTIHLDHQLVFHDNIRYPPQLSLLDDAAFAVGTNFDGQIAPVYFFAEALSPTIVETLARLDAGKPFDGLSNGLNNVIVDLLPSLTTPDRKSTQIYSRVTLSFHPARCTGPAVLDIFSSRHATLGAVTQAWNITSARDVLNSIGGVSCLLPMFPRLLVDIDAAPVQASSSPSSATASAPAPSSSPFPTTPSAGSASQASPAGAAALPPSPGAGLGTSWGDAADTEALQLLEPSPRAYLLADMDETKNDSCVGLLLTILARCITNHRIYQTELLNMSGIEMIEYALTCVPAEVMQLEGEGCILALTLLRSVVSGCLPLETRVTKRLVCNFAIWSRCRYSLQSSLMKVILADIRKQPAHFLSVVGVYGLLESMQTCYSDVESSEAASAADVFDESPLRSDGTPRPAGQGGRLSPSSLSLLPPEFAASFSLSSPLADPVSAAVSERASASDLPHSPVTPASRTTSVTSSGAFAGASQSNSNSLNRKPSFKSSLQKATREPGANPVDALTYSIVDVIPDPMEEDDDRPEKQEAEPDPSMLALDSLGPDALMRERLDSPHLDSPRHASEDSPPRQADVSATIDPGHLSARHQELLVLNYQRKRLRVCLQAMVMALVAHSGHAREIQPLVDLMATCKDLQLVNEVAQMLLCLLVEGGAKIISAITETCHGAEEFASFALRYLVHRPREELRCSGIRLITHYYLRVDLLPVSLVTLTLKRRKGGIFRRTMDQVALLSGGQGLQRLSICGGFALLAEVVHCHRRSSGYDTYTALLEMLLTKPGAKSQVTVQYNSLFEEADTPVLSARARDGLNRDGEAGTSMTVGPRTVVFAAHYISPDQVFDESLAVLNTAVLPVFFNLLPKLRLGLDQEQVFTDMLGLLKNSTGNREAFLQCPGWHLCVYLLVSRLMQEQRDSTAVLTTTAGVMTELQEAGTGSGLSGLGGSGADKAPTPRIDGLSISIPPPDSAAPPASEGDLDLWFTLGMKIYSTLLLHAVDRRPGGWREVMRTLSLSFDSLAGRGSPQSRTSAYTDEFAVPFSSAPARTKPQDLGMSFSQTVLSHLLNELTFLMQYKYKDLQRLARSNSAQEKEEANENLKNLLSTLIVSTQHALLEPAAVMGLRGLRIAQLRVQYLAETIQQERDAFREVPSPLPPGQRDAAAPPLGTAQPPATPVRAPQEQPSTPREALGGLGGCQSPDEEYLAELAEEALQRRVRQWQGRQRRGSQGASEKRGRSGAGQVEESDMAEEEDGEPLPRHLGEYTETYDFSHAWVHLGLPDKGERPADASFSSLPGSHGGYSQQGESQRRRKFAASERLQPLERSDTKQAGGLVLVLQILRFFDSVFLPNELGPLRNVPMLDFYKPPESLQEEPVSRPVTIFSSAMRLSLFVLQALSPLTDLATLNVRRMSALLAKLDLVSPYTTPVYDWMLAAVVHATFALQRASLSLMPAFRLLGITAPMTIFTTGLSDSTQEDLEEQRVVDEEELFDRAMDDVDTLTRVYALFSTVPGAHLMAHIRGCLLLLADLTDRNKAVLGGMMDETEFGVLCALAERVRAELGDDRDRLDASFLSTVDSAGPDGSTAPTPAPGTKPSSGSSSSSGSINSATANNNNNNHISDRSNPERVRSLSEMSLQSVASGQSDKSDPVWGEAAEDDARDRTFSNISHASAGAGPAEGHGPRFDLAGSRDCLRALRLLRDTFFHTDLLRVVGVVQALSNLELLETVSAQQHVQELSVFSDGLQAQRDFGRSMVEEMTELNNLSASVLKIMLYREQTRATAKRTEEALTLKNVAVQWEDCMRVFEMDWSPWCASSSWDQRTQGAGGGGGGSERAAEGHFELSKHKDSLMRRMLLTRSPEPIDHSDAAYLEGKQRDQMLFELGLPRNSALPGDPALGTPDQHFSSILKNDLVRPPHNKADLWGEEEEDGDDEGLPGGGKGQQHLNQLNIFGNASEKRPQWTYAFNWHSDERALLQLEASQITIDKVLSGVLLLTNKFLYFHPRKQTGGLAQESKSYQDQRWHLDRLVEAYGRRYLLQNCAIELLFADAPEVFLAFASLPELKTFFRTIRRQHVPLLTSPGYLKPRDLIARSPYTDMWRRRLISNFEYLMRLNLLAGRSYNDITQYPVFPWIIADYTSATLDLTNPATFRDLSKPMGALTPARLREIMDRYNGMDPEERFMYGSHYSSAGVVLHYMIRQEPFTTLAVNLQGGRFDCPDRVFFDIRHTWAGVTSSMSDVKELIPELFCCPEALLNTNRLPLGCLQDGGVVGDVVLPPWARDAFEFVRLNREALESDHVSDHLHEWIDLIFGYKQRGEEAIKAHNLFYYLTYENAIDIEAIEDPLQREAAKAQVTHFGQTPSQLLTTPHVRRLPREECMVPLCSDLSSLSNLVSFTPLKQLGYDGQHGPVISLRCSADKLVAVHADLTVGYYRWHSFPDGEGTPFTLRMERSRRLPSAALSASVGARGADQVLGVGAARPRGRGDSGDGGGVQAGVRSLMSFTSSLFSRIGGQGGGAASPDCPAARDEGAKPLSAAPVEEGPAAAAPSAPPAPIVPTAPAPASACLFDDGVSFLEVDARHVAIGLGDSGLAAIGGAGGRVVSCGYWDHTLKAHGLDSLRELASSSGGHVGPITCVELGHGTQTIISGGRDGTLRVWVLDGLKDGGAAAFAADGAAGSAGAAEGVAESSLTCVQSLWGHHSPVQCLSYAPELDLVLSGSQDGLLCLHTVRKGRFVRSVHAMAGKRVDLVLASSPGYLLAHSWVDHSLHLFWVNGEALVTVDMGARIQAMVVNGSGAILVCGLANGLLSLRALSSLQQLRVHDTLRGPVACLRFAEDNQFLLVGSADGTFSVMCDPELRMRMLYSAIQKTPLLGTL